MKIPIRWLENYIKLEHTHKEFGDIMTALEFMQDGPIMEINGEPVIDLEVRQNRPDMLSVIGAAREYAAYVGKSVNYPDQKNSMEVEWEDPSKLLNVTAKDIVKRFCAVEIENVKIGKSPNWIIKSLESYGIPAINNIVDITNYVMLEYGMPLHAFDYDKLAKETGRPLLEVRRAEPKEEFKTWQGTELKLSKEDLVVADSEKPVAIAGIIGGANSDIDSNTNHVILEAATYYHAAIRKTSARHNLRTDALTRHEKILNPEMVETAIRRALQLIEELCGGKVAAIEDYYEEKAEPVFIEFNTFEISRLGGVQLETEEVKLLLERLGFEILDQKEAIGLNKSIITVKVPVWRTDVNIEADLVEDVLRLWGYENIPTTQLDAAPPEYSTPLDLQLEEKIKNILVNLGLDEHITNPMVKYDASRVNQIQLENPLNADIDGLRTSIRETLIAAVERGIKAGNKKVGVFESGKVYIKRKIGEFVEEKRIEAIYSGYDFAKIKGDLLALLSKLGLNETKWREGKGFLEYTIGGDPIAILNSNGYEILLDNLVDKVNVRKVPYSELSTTFLQTIVEEVSLILNKNEKLGAVANALSEASDYISSVDLADIYEDVKLGGQKISATFRMVIEDAEKTLTREKVEELKNKALKSVKSSFGAEIRK